MARAYLFANILGSGQYLLARPNAVPKKSKAFARRATCAAKRTCNCGSVDWLFAPNGTRKGVPPKLVTSRQVRPARRRPHIHGSYRPQMSWTSAVDSLWYVHNQTGNIYTHAIALGMWLLVPLHARACLMRALPPVTLSAAEHALCWAFWASTTLMLTFSTAYHLFECAPTAVERHLYSCDIVDIAMSCTCICFINVWAGFRCAPRIALALTAVCATTGAMLTRSAVLHAADWTKLVVSFQKMAASCFLVVAALCSARTHLLARQQWPGDRPLAGVVASLASICVGSYVYNHRVPESWHPGRFDVWGHSHQLWHCFVFLSPLCTYLGVLHTTPIQCAGML